MASTANDPAMSKMSLIDFNVRAERMGWLPSAPQLEINPLDIVRAAEKPGMEPKRFLTLLEQIRPAS